MQTNKRTADSEGHDVEKEPRANLVSVVGARDKVEQKGEGVGSGDRDLAHVRASRAQVAQSNVNGEVTELVELRQKERKSRKDEEGDWEWTIAQKQTKQTNKKEKKKEKKK